MIISTIFLIFISYFLGSIPFSYLVAKAYKKNLYEIGSGNIGAANVYRATKKIEAMILAAGGDILKGFLAIIFARNFFGNLDPIFAQSLASFFVIAGHNWPIFLKFKGGRGLSSLAGCILAIKWQILLLVALILPTGILLVEILTKRGLKLQGPFKEKMKRIFEILISQVFGRMVSIGLIAILVLLLFPQAFKILIWGAILSIIKHLKRTKKFLVEEQLFFKK